MTVLIVVGVYLTILLMVGLASTRQGRGTSQDYFVASRTIGPFLLVMSVRVLTVQLLFGITVGALGPLRMRYQCW